MATRRRGGRGGGRPHLLKLWPSSPWPGPVARLMPLMVLFHDEAMMVSLVSNEHAYY